MIIVTIYNNTEVELSTHTHDIVTDEGKLFKAKYYDKMVNLLWQNADDLTKPYVDSLVAPDFECTRLEINHGTNTYALTFERLKQKPVAKQEAKAEETTPEVETPQTETADAELVQKTLANAAIKPAENEAPRKKPPRHRRTKAEMEAARAAAEKQIIESTK